MVYNPLQLKEFFMSPLAYFVTIGYPLTILVLYAAFAL